MENTKKIIKIGSGCFLLIFLISCNPKINKNNEINVSVQQYQKVKDILYTDNKENLYFEYPYPKRDSKGDYYAVYGYEDKIFDIKNDTVLKLKDILDNKNFHKIDNSEYYTDNKNIYVINNFASFVNASILDINVKQYKLVGQYIKDSNNVFVNARKLEEVDGRNFQQGFFKTKEIHNLPLGYDKKSLYFNETKVGYEEFLKFNLLQEDSLQNIYFPDKR